MTLVGAPDGQRAFASAQFAFPGASTQTQDIALPANTETISIVVPGATSALTPTVTGDTTGFKYPVSDVASSDGLYIASVYPGIDSSVTVDIGATGLGDWYVVADSSGRAIAVSSTPGGSPLPSSYTPTVKQYVGSHGFSGNPGTVTGVTTTAGSLLVIIADLFDAAINSISDSAGNTWVRRFLPSSGGMLVWTTAGKTKALTGGTITITTPGNGGIVHVYEIENSPTDAPFEIEIVQLGTGSFNLANVVSPSAANALVIAAIDASYNSTTPTLSSVSLTNVGTVTYEPSSSALDWSPIQPNSYYYGLMTATAVWTSGGAPSFSGVISSGSSMKGAMLVIRSVP